MGSLTIALLVATIIVPLWLGVSCTEMIRDEKRPEITIIVLAVGAIGPLHDPQCLRDFHRGRWRQRRMSCRCWRRARQDQSPDAASRVEGTEDTEQLPVARRF